MIRPISLALLLITTLTACEAEEPDQGRTHCHAQPRNRAAMITTRWVPVRVTHAVEIDMGCCRYRQTICAMEVPREMVVRTSDGWGTPLPPCTLRHDQFEGHPHVRYWFYEPAQQEPVMEVRDISEADGIERFDALPLCRVERSSEVTPNTI